MKYCVKCLQPDTRPGTIFDKRGFCPACNYYDDLQFINWDSRYDELNDIVKFGKQNNYSGYDCIIGVSGGKDSTRQAFYVRDTLKMNPLLVSLNYPPEQISQRGADNLTNLISHGFDCININPAPKTWKKLLKKGFFQFTNLGSASELALFSSVPRLAIAYQIPLIWWGENVTLQLGGDLSVMGRTGSDGNNLRKMNTLRGGDYSWMLDKEINKNNILQYLYPSEEDMEKANLRVTFLGYFWKDWSLIDNGNYSALRGLEIRNDNPNDIGDTYGITALDEDWVTINQMIKYYKYGFGRVSDYMNEEIRKTNITRDEAIKICQKYDGKCSDEIIKSFCKYIDITIEEFYEHIDKSINLSLFEKVKVGNYIPKFKIGVGL